ncbi:MAG: hypothetical protein AAF581_10410 [Planctomycetota bacterium]
MLLVAVGIALAVGIVALAVYRAVTLGLEPTVEPAETTSPPAKPFQSPWQRYPGDPNYKLRNPSAHDASGVLYTQLWAGDGGSGDGGGGGGGD